MHVILIAESARTRSTALALRRLRAHHGGLRVTVVVTDPLEPVAPLAGADTVAATTLPVAGGRFIDAWLGGGPAFARWALVPALADLAGDEPALVLAATARVTGPLDDLLELVGDRAVGLFPRRFDDDAEVGSEGWIPDLAVLGPASRAVTGWWERAARRRLLGDETDAVFADPWRHFVEGGPGITVVTDPSVRLSPHSVQHLVVTQDDGTVTVDGTPLRLAQFPAFDPERPWWYVTSTDAEPTVLTSENPALGRLCLDQAADLAAEPGDDPPTEAHAPIGVPVGAALRAAFRRRLAEAADDGTVAPNPLDPSRAGDFFSWLRAPGEPDVTGVSRMADLIWSDRPDLAATFPRVRWRDRDAFLRWLWVHGPAEGLITTALLPGLPAVGSAGAGPTADGNALPFGVNLVGYHDSDLGLGVAVRRVGAALDAAGVPWTRVVYDRTHSRRRDRSRTQDAAAPYRFNLILIAPDQLAFFVEDVGESVLAGRYNIGLWYWETDVLSDRQLAAIDLVDEIWGATRYLVDVFAAHTAKPVRLVPVPLEFHPAPTHPGRRAALGLDDRFTFLFTFDFFSIAERKNPLGLVAAYRAAFGPDDGCRLILKSINADRHLAEAEELRAAFADRPDVELWDRYLGADERLALVAEVDCYVSLHRSEGLGLTMAEAMAAGTPVVATGYSGNLDFMPEGAALLVDAHEVEIGPGSFYPATGHWADPDLDHAARLLRRVRDDASLRESLAEAGPRALRPFTAKRVGAEIAARLTQLDPDGDRPSTARRGRP